MKSVLLVVASICVACSLAPAEMSGTWHFKITPDGRQSYVEQCSFIEVNGKFWGACTNGRNKSRATIGIVRENIVAIYSYELVEGRPVIHEYKGVVSVWGTFFGFVDIGKSLGTFSATKQAN